MRPATVRRDRSLAWHLAALKMVLAVPLLALTVIPTATYMASERVRLESVAKAAREDILSLIDRDFSAKAAILRALATSPALDDGDFDRFDSQARELIGSERFNIVLRDRTGRQLANTIVPRGTPLPERPNPVLDGRLLEPKEPFISDLFRGQVSKQLVTVMVVPVFRGGEVAYTLLAVLSSAYFTELLTQKGPPAPYYAVVAGRDGIIIASSYRGEDFVGKELPGFREITLSEGTWSGANPLGTPVSRIHRRSALSGWVIAVAVPQAALTASRDRFLWLAVALGSAVVLVAVGSAVFLSRKLTRVFRSLSVAARRIGDGEIVAVPRNSLREANEIGTALAQASRKLSEHADVLERANEHLERRVDERTRELRSAAEAYRSIVDTAMDAIVVGDERGRICFFNKGAESIFGYSADEVLGQSIGILAPEPHRSAHDRYIENHRATGRPMAVCARRGVIGCHKNGAEIPIELSVAEWHDGAGRLHFTGILRDVSQRERQADELRTAKDLAELALARVETASQAKSQFLASMSHELRTPLNAISGFAQLLCNAGDALVPERRMRYARNIVDASGHLKSIVDELLDLARIETGQIAVDCEALDCLEVMSEVSRTLEVEAKKRNIIFTVDTSANLPLVLADRARLIQVLLNLGTNAIKYNTDDGWVLLAAYPKDDMVRFVVRDTGRGIPAERQAEIFEPFNRLGAELGSEEGMGIGLALSRKLMHAMQGKIGFESVAGAGSKFWIDVPVAGEASLPKAVPALTRLPLAGDFRSKVLYIEDKIPNVELMRSIIEDLSNTQLVEAQTVEDGVAIARSIKPDLVITDIHLPDGKGFDVLERLRGDPATAHIPVIALTADAMPTNMHNMQRFGFDHVVTKPFKIPDLMDVVRTRLMAA